MIVNTIFYLSLSIFYFPVSFRGIMPSNIDQKKSREKRKKNDIDTMLNSLADYVYITKIYVLIFK